MSLDYEKLLRDPFESEDIKWRVQQNAIRKDGSAWVLVIPYLTSRAIQTRLDDTFGLAGWKNEFIATTDGKGYLCGLSVKIDDEWITKWDGAEYTRIEPLKGALSGATKRSAVQLGMGRYLYAFEAVYINCRAIFNKKDLSPGSIHVSIKENKNDQYGKSFEWDAPDMPSWALPSTKKENLIDDIKKSKTEIELKSTFKRAYHYATSFKRSDLIAEFIEVKDKMKLKLKLDNSEELKKEESEIKSWLLIRVSDLILEATNESVLKLNKKKISLELQDKTLNSDVDLVDMMKILESLYQKQLIKLKQGL